MRSRRIERRLAAILAADVVGYSRMMEHDEVATVTRLRAYQHDLLEPLLAANRGRIVNCAGDSALCEFISVVDAVTCAVALQEAMVEFGRNAADGEPIRLRVGVNLGEILVEGQDIYGDGVNVAARLQALAEPGGICVSGKVHREAHGKLPYRFADLGSHRVKNITEPISVYRVTLSASRNRQSAFMRRLGGLVHVRTNGLAMTVVALLAIALVAWIRSHPSDKSFEYEPARTDRPSIAILPFDDMSASRDQQFFADGISEELITGLAKFPDLFVIARNSTFTYKNKPIDIRQVGRELGARYVVEGSIQRADDQVRVVAQLIDASSGHHLWANSYDRRTDRVFFIRDDITQNIAGALMGTKGRLAEAEIARVSGKDPKNFTAYDYLMRGWYEWYKFTREGNLAARRYFESARNADPNYARAFAGLAWTYSSEYDFEWTDDYKKTVALALEMATKAVSLDSNDYRSHWALGWAHLYNWEHEAAMASYMRARELNPNDAELLAEMANLLIYNGNPKQAIDQLTQAMQLNPFHEDWYVEYLGWAYEEAGMPAEAIATLDQVIGPNPGTEQVWLLRTLAAALADPTIGRTSEANAVARKILALEPDFTITKHRQFVEENLPYRTPAQIDRWIGALRRTGLPE